jgi:hypothetical protein
MRTRGPSVLAACCAAILFGQSSHASAQSDAECTSTAMTDILKTFPSALKIEFECEKAWLNGEPSTICMSGWPTEKVDTKLDESILAACPGSASTICASASADQYDGLIRAAMSDGETPEPDPARLLCREAIASASDKLARKSVKLLRKCNERALGGDPSYGPAGAGCTDAAGKAPAKVARAEEKLRKDIFRRCGGADRVAGGGDDMDPQDLGFSETCRGGPDCVEATPDLSSLADCLLCTAAQEVGEAATGALALPLSPIQTCKVRIDHAYTDLARDVLDLLWDCERDRLNHETAPSCPSERTLVYLEERRLLATQRVETACAALDPQDDLGFASTCPDVGTCGTIEVSAMSGQIECLTCVTEARAGVLFAAAYPVQGYEADQAKADCRQEIGDSIVDRFTAVRFLELYRCDRGRNCGITTDACPDERRIENIETFRQRMQEDLLDTCVWFAPPPVDPQDLGYGLTCPDVLGCGGPETDTFAGLSACLFCLSAATVDDLRSTFSPWP